MRGDGATASERDFILAGAASAAYVDRPGDITMADQRPLDIETDLYRRRASDRARERAGRAAWYGDRAGLLIATGTAEALMSLRAQQDPPPVRRD
jgi:rare lipoprotein A (peptidoglycan hydrolase)